MRSAAVGFSRVPPSWLSATGFSDRHASPTREQRPERRIRRRVKSDRQGCVPIDLQVRGGTHIPDDGNMAARPRDNAVAGSGGKFVELHARGIAVREQTHVGRLGFQDNLSVELNRESQFSVGEVTLRAEGVHPPVRTGQLEPVANQSGVDICRLKAPGAVRTAVAGEREESLGVLQPQRVGPQVGCPADARGRRQLPRALAGAGESERAEV